MGTFSRSWDLLGQSFSLLKSDKQLIWLPIVSGISCILATLIIFSSAFLFLVPAGGIPHGPAGQKLITQEFAPFVFLYYLVTYSIVIFFNVALVSIASNRLAGGQATINDGLQAAWARKWRIFQWALLSATVGMILRAIQERAGFIGRIIIGIVGFVWTLASFFVVPLIAAEDIGPVEALYKSVDLFRKTWGEELVSGFSFGLIFIVLALPSVLLPFVAARFGPQAIAVSAVIMILYWIALAIISSAAQGIFVAALYRYATTGEVAAGFDRDELASAWRSKGE